MTAPLATRWGSGDPHAPLIVLFQAGHDTDLAAFARYLPGGAAYASVRLPAGSPFDAGAVWFRGWLDEQRAPPVPVVLAGFGDGAAFAGGLLLADPTRFAAVALLHGTLPFDAGLPVTRGRLAGVPVFLTHGQQDTVIPVELQRRTWDYLVRESGSPLWAQRQPGGHELSATTVSGLAGWIEARLGFLQRRPTPVADPGPVCWPGLPDGRLPVRPGEAPEVSVTTPQQQQSQNAPLELQEELFARIMRLAGVTTAPSAVSVPGARAFMLAPGTPRGPDEGFIVPDLGEFAHLHPGYDGSLHLVLPVPLAHDALVKGWAVAHPLAGLRLTPGLVMIFGPRNSAELDIITAIAHASHVHATTGAPHSAGSAGFAIPDNPAEPAECGRGPSGVVEGEAGEAFPGQGGGEGHCLLFG